MKEVAPADIASVAQSEFSSAIPSEKYQAGRTDQFPNLPAWKWFERKHRRALVEANALLIVNRRPMIIPSLADEVVLRICREVAKAA